MTARWQSRMTAPPSYGRLLAVIVGEWDEVAKVTLLLLLHLHLRLRSSSTSSSLLKLRHRDARQDLSREKRDGMASMYNMQRMFADVMWPVSY